ncbi:MAG: hypothetical protein JNM93_05875 [Bacteriovoracaceae bacterium]|nr:hypothetical protein [Bacteriovoracaceae bacterium]
MKCRHYQVTWDKNFPRGCRLFQIKSKQSPATVVKQNTGSHCQEFQERKAAKKDQGLNDDKLWE